MTEPDVPELHGQALEAVQYRGGHLQIIASAGSGKTEVVSQRVADLLADGFPPECDGDGEPWLGSHGDGPGLRCAPRLIPLALRFPHPC